MKMIITGRGNGDKNVPVNDIPLHRLANQSKESEIVYFSNSTPFAWYRGETKRHLRTTMTPIISYANYTLQSNFFLVLQ